MKYYVHHIRDFNNATRHLTRIERSIYRDMIELYYDSEEPLPLDMVALCRKVVARTEEEKSAVLALLDEFFEETPEGWRNQRCDEDIAVAAVKMDDEEARKENERERQRRHRDRRKELFERLREFDDVPAYDTKTEVLQQRLDTHLSRVTSQRQTPDATANHNPEPITHNPSKNLSSEQSPDSQAVEQAGPAEPKAEKPRKHHGTEDDHKAARWIFERVQKVDATAKEPNWNGWANDVRLMREIDGRTHVEICDMFAWANKDSFWCSNILSPGKLREKWGTLAARRQQPQVVPATRPNGRPSINSMTDLGADDPFNNFRRA